MTDFEQFELEDMRLSILKTLHMDTDGRLADRLIVRSLDMLGFNPTPGRVREQVEWLAANNAVAVQDLPEGRFVVTLLEAGEHHVERREYIEGVLRPKKGR